MKGIKRHIKYIIIGIAACVLIVACEKNFINPPPNNLTKSLLYDIMKEWYLWYDTMPDVNPGDYNSLHALLDDLKISPPDRWSYVTSTEEHNRLNQQGEYIGHGFGLKWDADGKLRITFAFNGTSAESQGVERGWELLSINGEMITTESYVDSLLGADSVGVQNTFSFLNNSSQSTSLTLTKEIIDIKTVLYSDVIELDTVKVGYLVYQQFLSTSIAELDEVFGTFIENSVDDVIVDLRYNPGGQVDVAQHLGSLLAGDYAVKRTFVQFEFNDKQAGSLDRTRPFQDVDKMLVPTPDRIFFITSGGSASASELVINSLFGLRSETRPFNVYLIGDDTHGKPVGSIVHSYNDTTLVPITFKYSNRLGEGEFFEGLPADSYIDEDISKAFGDPEELLLKEVLYFIENGSFTGAGKKKSRAIPQLQLQGIYSEIGAI